MGYHHIQPRQIQRGHQNGAATMVPPYPNHLSPLSKPFEWRVWLSEKDKKKTTVAYPNSIEYEANKLIKENEECA